jgi:16S rRNA (cytosine967-C5)-methyltransferase
MKNKIHRNLAEAIVQALHIIYNEGLYADKVVEKTLKADKRRGARDRRFIAQGIYECVRWKRLYSSIAGIDDFTIENIWKIFGVYAVLQGFTLPEWEELISLKEKEIKNNYEKAKKIRSLRESIPDWMDALGEQALGEAWETELTALNQPARVVLRVNTLKISKEALIAQFQKEGIETQSIDGYPDALLLTNRANVFHTYAFRKGFFEMQDASSQLVARFVNPQPGMRVIDACAGAGGKALHLANLMENKGQIIAMDIHGYKLDALRKRAKRNGIHNIETRVISGTKTIKKLKESADKVLIDAPCSGMGVLRRNPDAKWKLKPNFINKIKQVQHDILDQYAEMVKVGGQLVYATCSILPEENEKQVEKFLDDHTNFKFVDEIKVSVAQSGYDGFYMALMERIN